jgi:hypothetical protein
MQTISVIFRLLNTKFGVPYYHETLAYTNSAGVVQYATAGPTIRVEDPNICTVSQSAAAAFPVKVCRARVRE